MRGKWVLISVAAVLAGAAGGALSLRHRRADRIPAGSAAGAAVIAASEITLSGSVRPQHITAVPVPEGVDGNIEAFTADVGDEVAEGQVLARIGAAGLATARETAADALEHAQQEVATAQAALNSAMLEQARADAAAARSRMALDRAEKTFSRQRTLLAAGATPRLTYQKAEQEYSGAQTESAVMDKAARAAGEEVRSATERLDAARKVVSDRTRQLDDAQTAAAAAEVQSPVDGTIVARNGEPGKPVAEAGKDLFQIATDLYALEVAVEPPPHALKRIMPGQPALVLILDLQSAAIPGQVKAIEGSQVIVQFESTSPAIRPGARADVRLKLD
jgi:multidrug resistance efflux pump